MSDTSILVGRILASTRRQKRTLSILEIASDIQALINQTGSAQKVSETIGISTGMMNQFLSAFKLSPEVQQLVSEKRIDSVALVFILSKFSEADIKLLTPRILEGKLSSQDLKVLLPFRRKHPKENVLDLLEKVHASKDIKISVIRLPSKLIKEKDLLITTIKTLIGDDNFYAAEEENNFLDIKISKDGERILRRVAKGEKATLQQLILRLVNNGG